MAAFFCGRFSAASEYLPSQSIEACPVPKLPKQHNLTEHKKRGRRPGQYATAPMVGSETERIVAYLRAHPLVAHADAARLLGCSRQLVEQASARWLGESGRKRQALARQATLPKCKGLTEAERLFIEAARNHGITAKPFVKLGSAGSCTRRGIVANGYLCKALRAYTDRFGHTQLRPTRRYNPDFVAFLLDDGHFLICPPLSHGTSISANGKWHQRYTRDPNNIKRIVGTKTCWHDYIDAWWQLEAVRV